MKAAYWIDLSWDQQCISGMRCQLDCLVMDCVFVVSIREQYGTAHVCQLYCSTLQFCRCNCMVCIQSEGTRSDSSYGNAPPNRFSWAEVIFGWVSCRLHARFEPLIFSIFIQFSFVCLINSLKCFYLFTGSS